MLCLVGLLGFGGCSTDFDVNAPYKRIPVIHAFLDASAPVQYARVQRTFQNRSGDARQIAENDRDSSEYGANEVTLTLFSGDGTRQLGIYQPQERTDKDTNGAFYGPNHRVYALNLPVGTLGAGQWHQCRADDRVVGGC